MKRFCLLCPVCGLFAECFCGNSFRGKKTHDSDCDSSCAGKESTVCGGHSRISVYECNEHYEEEEEEEVMKPEPENMLGCYKDTSSKRVLNLKTNYKLDDMTPEVRRRLEPSLLGAVVVVACCCRSSPERATR